jgi:hypothetical protein
VKSGFCSKYGLFCKKKWAVYLPELQYIKGTHNVVADTLSWLDINETPIEKTRETFLGQMECFGLKQPDEIEFHP